MYLRCSLVTTLNEEIRVWQQGRGGEIKELATSCHRIHLASTSYFGYHKHRLVIEGSEGAKTIMHRFFIPRDWICQDRVSLMDEQARQIFHVLRLKPKAHIIVLDNSGWEYEVEIEKVTGKVVEGKVTRRDFCLSEPKIKITLYQALLKGDKFEFVLQKGVELGISAFVPLLCQNCVAGKPGENKIARWGRIIREAAEQSRRGLMPALHPMASFEEACDSASNPSILLWEAEESRSLSQILESHHFQNSQAVNVFVGPEGGFLPGEVEYVRPRGIIPASLGRRILRAETAGLLATSIVLYHKGEFEVGVETAEPTA